MNERGPRPRPGHSADKVAPLLADTPYRLHGFLGGGNMSEVWVVEHEFLRRRFALKILRPHLRGLADRPRIEAQTMGRINHPNVLEVVDFWTNSEGVACIVMELLEGRNLWDELVDRRTLPVTEAVNIVCQALSALGAAHALGVVHRDVKPENLFLHEVPSYGRVLKVLDFGIARVVPGAPSRAPAPPAIRTATGTRVGSPLFMSPEAARGERVDARGDIYSVGLVLYAALVGYVPDDLGQGEPRPPSLLAPSNAPAELDPVILRAIREVPAERYQSAAEFLAVLRPFARTTNPATGFL